VAEKPAVVAQQVAWSGAVLGLVALAIGLPTYLIYKAVKPKRGSNTKALLTTAAVAGGGFYLLDQWFRKPDPKSEKPSAQTP
jgi:hypothetical protein